jgi:hypothetical protein
VVQQSGDLPQLLAFHLPFYGILELRGLDEMPDEWGTNKQPPESGFVEIATVIGAQIREIAQTHDSRILTVTRSTQTRLVKRY